MKFGKKLATLSEKNLTVNLYTMNKYVKIKIKSYNGKINTNFHNNEIPKEGFQRTYLSLILINSVYRKDKNYYPQVFLEKCTYAFKEKKKKTSKFNTADIEIYFDDSDRQNSDEENQILNFFNLGARKSPKFPKVQFPKI